MLLKRAQVGRSLWLQAGAQYYVREVTEMGSKEPTSAEGKGGAFRREANTSKGRAPVGARAALDEFGSIGECIERVIACGAYISFGATTDGGALLIRVLDGDDKLSTYCHTRQEVLEAMEALKKLYKPAGLRVLPIGA
jgi:hypothetical protein